MLRNDTAPHGAVSSPELYFLMIFLHSSYAWSLFPVANESRTGFRQADGAWTEKQRGYRRGQVRRDNRWGSGRTKNCGGGSREQLKKSKGTYFSLLFFHCVFGLSTLFLGFPVDFYEISISKHNFKISKEAAKILPLSTFSVSIPDVVSR